MKKTILFPLALLLLAVSCFALTRWGLPYNVDIAAYAVDNYAQYRANIGSTVEPKNLKRAVKHKDRFISQLQARLNSKYPSISSVVRTNKENSAANKNNWSRNDTTNINLSEFVFFAGHGSHTAIMLYDSIAGGSNLNKPIKTFNGTWTRWVIFDDCLTLASPTNSIPAEAYHLVWLMGGTHSALGYKSWSWEFVNPYNCFITCDHYRSEDTFNKFAARFVTNGETIWSAWQNAVGQAIYYDGGEGIEPAIAYHYGYADNGQYINFSEERLQSVYNGPFNQQNGATNDFVTSRSWIYGRPTY